MCPACPGQVPKVHEQNVAIASDKAMRTEGYHLVAIINNKRNKIESKSYLGYEIGGFIGRKEHVGQLHGKYKFLGSFDN